ncbi:glycosyltransferase [Candidatus Woesearchaeota archaeon]|nr:glycosyltransferase [Candidatus Woesearchaeota archaeon]
MELSIIIPAHNEEQNLPSLLDSLLSLVKKNSWNAEIIVSDDHSTDATASIADKYSSKHKNIRVIHRRDGNRGMGYTLREATKNAKGEIIIWTMADKSDDLSTFRKLVSSINDGYDMVFGARYIRGGSKGDLAMHKAISSSTYSKVAAFLFRMRVHDITNAFRAFRKEVFDAVTLNSGDFAISPEFAIKANLLGYRLGEVPTTYSDRKAGRTSFKMLKMAFRYGSLFRYLFLPVKKKG